MRKTESTGKRLAKAMGILLIGIAVCAILYVSVYAMIALRPEPIPIGTYPSPDGKRVINAYCYGTLSVNGFVRCYISDTRIPLRRLLYQEMQQTEVEAEWLDNHTVRLNGEELNIWFGYQLVDPSS